jgi:hypothetical protein
MERKYQEDKKLHNLELHDVYSSPNIITVLKSRNVQWEEEVALMGKMRNVRWKYLMRDVAVDGKRIGWVL